MADPVFPVKAGETPPIRASHAEREQAVEVLSIACAEGRLTLEEMGVRVASAYSAVSRADLEPLVADLPSTPGTAEAAVAEEPPPQKQKARWIVAIMGETSRHGHWRIPRRSKVVTIMGETKLDLRQAIIDSPVIEMRLFVLMGEIQVIVPDGVEVEATGVVIMGERKVDVSPVAPRPGVPRVNLHIIGLMGEVRVRTG